MAKSRNTFVKLAVSMENVQRLDALKEQNGDPSITQTLNNLLDQALGQTAPVCTVSSEGIK